MKCYISSSCSTKKSLPDVMRELLDIGFRAIEMTGNIQHSDDLVNAILKYKDLYDLNLTIHNYLPIYKDDIVLNLSSCVADTRNKTLNVVHHAIDLSRKLGNNLYSLHPGFRHELLPKMINGFFMRIIEKENCNTRELFYNTVQDISQTYSRDGFKIAIENLSPKNSAEIYSFLCTPDDIMDFLNHFRDNPTVGMLLDFGHLNVASQILGFDKYDILDRMFSDHRDRIFEIHLSDNDGTKDFHQVSASDSWQIEYLVQNGVDLKGVPVVMEWQGCASKEAFERYELIREKIEGL